MFEPYDHWEETSEGEINNTGSEEGGVGVILISDELPRVGRDVLDVLCDPRAPRLGRFTFYPGPCDDKEVKEILKPFNEILEATDGFNEVVGCSENGTCDP